MEEEWRDIYFEEDGVVWDYRGLYQVSNIDGKIKSLKFGKEKILKPVKTKNGYQNVILCKDGKKKFFYIHRLVAHMFCGGYFEGAEVDHIDTNKINNKADNLRWVTSKENCNNPLTKDNYSNAKKGKTKSDEHKRKISEAMKGSLIECWKDGELVNIKYQFEYVKLGFNAGNISSCCKGKIKSTGGYIFKYHKKEVA